jgi:signal transduction histidine kinase
MLTAVTLKVSSLIEAAKKGEPISPDELEEINEHVSEIGEKVRSVTHGLNPVGVEEGLGMRTMRHRASIIGGSLTLGESSEGGVVVQCRVPAPPRR